MQLNKAQMEAATHKEGPLLVLAAPGSGKTTVICKRVHYLIEEEGVLADRICVLTFTKEAAGLMQKRINQEHSYPVCIATVHSLCYQILSQHSILKSRKILTRSQHRELIRRVLQEQHANEKNYIACMEEIDETANEFTRLSSYVNTALDPDPQSAYALYQRRKEELGVFDFNDLLVFALQALSSEVKLREFWQKQFDHYLVDEFQDLNEIQFRILTILAEPHKNIMVVGDDDQSIYAFRGSSPLIVKRFQENYPSCSCINLDRNYRCSDAIIELSRICIEQNHGRFNKELCGTGKRKGQIQCLGFSGPQEQMTYIMKKAEEYKQELTKEEINGKTKHTAILFRTGKQKEEFCSLLQKAREGNGNACLRMQRNVLQDLKHYLNLIQKQDELQDVLAIMNHPDRGLSKMFLPIEDFSIESWERFCIHCKETQQAKKVHEFRMQLKNMERFGAGLGIRYLMDTCGYGEYIINKFNKNKIEKTDLEIAFKKLMNRLNSTNWKEFEIKLNKELSYLDKKELEEKKEKPIGNSNGICFLTMHAAKGLEFDTVFLPNLNEGLFPSGKSVRQGELEQERRLFYVAMTRAQKNLIITYLESDRQKKKSRFLSELGF